MFSFSKEPILSFFFPETLRLLNILPTPNQHLKQEPKCLKYTATTLPDTTSNLTEKLLDSEETDHYDSDDRSTVERKDSESKVDWAHCVECKQKIEASYTSGVPAFRCPNCCSV